MHDVWRRVLFFSLIMFSNLCKFFPIKIQKINYFRWQFFNLTPRPGPGSFGIETCKPTGSRVLLVDVSESSTNKIFKSQPKMNFYSSIFKHVCEYIAHLFGFLSSLKGGWGLYMSPQHIAAKTKFTKIKSCCSRHVCVRRSCCPTRVLYELKYFMKASILGRDF